MGMRTPVWQHYTETSYSRKTELATSMEVGVFLSEIKYATLTRRGYGI